MGGVLASLGSAQDRAEAEDAVASAVVLKGYRALTVALLLGQVVWSVLFQPDAFHHMFTNWSLFVVTGYYAGAAWWSLRGTRDSDGLHRFLSGVAVVAVSAMSLVVPIYWGNGADKLDINPGLMLLNHSWTWPAVVVELGVLSGTVLRWRHFVFFPPYLWAYALGALPALQGAGMDPYDLPFVFADEPEVAFPLAVVSPLVGLLLGHGPVMLLQYVRRRRAAAAAAVDKDEGPQGGAGLLY